MVGKRKKNRPMNTVKINSLNTKMVAHRGVSGLEPENTVAAFVAAGNRSYYGVETDIYRTADGRFVVNHDGNAKRVGGVDMAMETSTLEELQKIVLFDVDGTKGRPDLRLPSLENYISVCKRYGKYCVLELKSVFTEEETRRILEIVDSYDYRDHVIFISFHYA